MDSFAFFYKIEKDNKEQKDNNMKVDLHINVWSLKRIMIDIGLKIENIDNNIKRIFIYLPTKEDIKDNEIKCLSKELKNPDLASLIFNDNCSISSENIIEIGKIKYHLIDIKKDAKIENNILELEINRLMSSEKNLYLRFRIDSNTLSKELILTSDNIINTLFKSNIALYNIIDIKINKRRNFDYKNLVLKDNYILFDFNKIHFVVMDYIYSSINFLSNISYESRILEIGWENYINSEKPSKKNLKNIIAYHFKIKKSDNSNEAGFVLKILKNKATNIRYIITAIIIGIISGIMSSIIPSLINKLILIFRS